MTKNEGGRPASRSGTPSTDPLQPVGRGYRRRTTIWPWLALLAWALGSAAYQGDPGYLWPAMLVLLRLLLEVGDRFADRRRSVRR